MAIQVSGTEVISNARALTNIASVDATTAAAITAAGVGGGSWALLDQTTWASVVGVYNSNNVNVTVASHTLAKTYQALTWYMTVGTLGKSSFNGAFSINLTAGLAASLDWLNESVFQLQASASGTVNYSNLKGTKTYIGSSWYNGITAGLVGGNLANESSFQTDMGNAANPAPTSTLGFSTSISFISGTILKYAPICRAYTPIQSNNVNATNVTIQLWGIA
jgi:hypothetical protein